MVGSPLDGHSDHIAHSSGVDTGRWGRYTSADEFRWTVLDCTASLPCPSLQIGGILRHDVTTTRRSASRSEKANDVTRYHSARLALWLMLLHFLPMPSLAVRPRGEQLWLASRKQFHVVGIGVLLRMCRTYYPRAGRPRTGGARRIIKLSKLRTRINENLWFWELYLPCCFGVQQEIVSL